MADLGAYSSFVGERGETLAWLQRVDSIGVNGVHAIVVAPVLIRLEMLRIERTYDLLITRHSLAALGRQCKAAAREFDPFLWPKRKPGDGALGKRCRLPRFGLARFSTPGQGNVWCCQTTSEMLPPESHRQCAASDAVTAICSDLG